MTKGDPYHDKIGRFTTGPSGGASVSTNKLDAIFAKNAPRRITTFALPHDRVTELFNAMKNEGLVPQNLRSSFSIQWKGVDRNWQDGSFDNTFESHQQFKDFLATEGRRIDTVLASNATSADASSKMNNAIRAKAGVADKSQEFLKQGRKPFESPAGDNQYNLKDQQVESLMANVGMSKNSVGGGVETQPFVLSWKGTNSKGITQHNYTRFESSSHLRSWLKKEGGRVMDIRDVFDH